MENKSITFIRFPFSSRMGGEELHTIKLATYLSKKGYKIRLISNCDILIKLFKESKFEVHEFDAPKPPVTKTGVFTFFLKLPYFIFRFKKNFPKSFFKNESATYLLNLGEKIALSSYLSKTSKKIFFLEHALVGNWLLKNPFLISLRRSLKLKNINVICVSNLMKSLLNKAYKTNIKVIRNGFYSEDLKNKSEFKNKGNIKKIGFLGRFTPEKGSKKVLELAKEFPDIEFLISSKSKNKHIKNIKYLGFLNETQKIKFFKKIDLLILPVTKMDPFGLVVLESISQKTPVLMTKLVGASEYFTDNLDAFICKPEKLSEKLEYIITNPSIVTEVSKNAFLRLPEFSADNMHEEFLKLI